MNYPDGQQVRLWDRVEVWPGCRGIVVASIDTNEYSPAFPREEWQYLGRGVMLDTDGAGLIHFPESDAHLVLLTRGGPPTADEVAALRNGRADGAATRDAE
jgi:hypothetical protein